MTNPILDAPRKNYIHWLDDAALDYPVYRIMSFEWLKKIYRDSTNCLVRPIKWDDPFENILFSAIGLEKDGRQTEFGFRNDFYGQCWTDADESDAMWRIYSPAKSGARIRCTPRKLLNYFYQTQDIFRNISCFIGKVVYLEQTEIVGLLNDVDFVKTSAFDATGLHQCRTLLFKRKAFTHESEVRLLYQRPKTDHTAGDYFIYPITPLTLFDEIVLDPRLTDAQESIATDELRNLGVSCPVFQSDLYKIPKLYARLN